MAILLSLALRIPFFRIPMLADEGGYAYATRGWVNGTGELYGDLWISRPQGIFFVYAGIFDLFGTGTTALRFAAWIAIALTVIAIWGFTRMCASPCAANLAALVFAVTSSLPNLEGYSANAEMFMGFPVALAALWLLRISHTGWSPAQLVGVGVLIGIAISLKPSAAAMIPAALAFIFLLDDAGLTSTRARLGRFLSLGAGVTIIGLGSLFHGWLLGWDDFIYATFTYRLTAQSAATVGLQHNLQSIGRLALQVAELIAVVALLLAVRYPIDVSAGWRRLTEQPKPTLASIRAAFRWPAALGAKSPITLHRPSDAGQFLLRLWLLASLLGASIGGDWWSHYLIQVVAPLSVWMGWTIALTWPTLARTARYVVAAALIVLLFAPFQVMLRSDSGSMTRALFDHPGYPAQDEVAAYLREHSEPGTTIYVAFDQAAIYYLADRPPAYRHLYDQELRGIPSSYSDLITIIRGPNRPEFIVSTRQPGPFADDSRAFWQEVGQYYDLVATIDGVPIYQDKDTIAPATG